MKDPLVRHIFLIRRGSGDLLILHPFRPGDALFRDPENLVLEGRYGVEPDAAAASSLRSSLHQELDKGARADALDRKFYTRLLVCAGVFLALYTFLSIFVRDPIPLVDELLIGALGAAASWFALERRALSSPMFSERSAGLRRALDATIFRSSRVARALEECLQDAESLNPDKYAAFLESSLELEMSEEDAPELAALATSLETRIPADAAEAVRRFLSDKADSATLVKRIASRRKSDLPMVLSYARVRARLGVAK